MSRNYLVTQYYPEVQFLNVIVPTFSVHSSTFLHKILYAFLSPHWPYITSPSSPLWLHCHSNIRWSA